MEGKLSSIEVERLLLEFDKCFRPTILSEERNLNIKEYSKKLSENAVFFIQKDREKNVGFATVYSNSKDRVAYLVFLAIHDKYRKKGYGYNILKKIEEIALENGMDNMKLEVRKNNTNAIRFYENNEYIYLEDASESSIYMIKSL